MALAEQEKPKNAIEQIGETDIITEREIGQTAKKVEKAAEEGTLAQTPDVSGLKKPEVQEQPEIIKEELEEKSIKYLEPILAERIDKTIVAQVDKDPVINKIVDEIVEKLTDKEEKYEDIATKLSDVAYAASNGDVGTYGWLLEEFELRARKALDKRSIM
jgi:hypothetical protein